MAEIIPAILPKDAADLSEKCGLLSGRAPFVHIDVVDAGLRPGEDGLPHEDTLNFEAHLMVGDPEVSYEAWVRAGVERLIVHVESDFARIVDLKERLDLEVGLALKFETPVSALLPHIFECDFIQMMSIAELGRQGERFEEGIFDKIKELRASYPETIISVDGGVNEENALRLIEAGVDRLVVGSAIWQAEDALGALEDLQSL